MLKSLNRETRIEKSMFKKVDDVNLDQTKLYNIQDPFNFDADPDPGHIPHRTYAPPKKMCNCG